MTAEKRLELRQLESRPVWNRLLSLVEGAASMGVLPKEKINEAVTYIRNHKEALDIWRKRVRKAAGAGDRGMIRTHAKWTVLFIAGRTAREIADNEKGLRNNRNLRHPDKYVRTSIARFCDSIHLQLPNA